MHSIPPRLEQVTGFSVIGHSTRTQNSDEFSPQTAKIPALWQTFYNSDLAASAAPVYGVYSDYVSDVNGLYTLTVGIASANTHNTLSSRTIASGNYLVFEGKGPMPATVIATWQRVWDYFTKESEYQRTYRTDFEVYKSADEVAVYIGVH